MKKIFSPASSGKPRQQSPSLGVVNLLQGLPSVQDAEVVTTLLQHNNVRIERIHSTGQCSPEDQWYDQHEHEWVLLLQGQAELMLADGSLVALAQGDSYFLPAGCRHRVHWTDPEQTSLWLAIFWSPSADESPA